MHHNHCHSLLLRTFIDMLPTGLDVSSKRNDYCIFSKPNNIAWHPLANIVRLLTHWGRVTHICVSKLITIGSDNALSPGRRQAIIWTNAGILLIGHFGTNFSEISIEIYTFSFKKMHLKMSSGKRWQFCLGLNMLMMLWIDVSLHRMCSKLHDCMIDVKVDGRANMANLNPSMDK